MQAADSFGYVLKRRRKALDLTQAQLAAQVGCTAAAIRKIEADERKPSLQLAGLLANFLQVPTDQRAAFLQRARGVQPEAALPLPAAPLESTSGISPGEFPNNLPTPLTSLIDRTSDITRVAGLLTDPAVRLLTLVGTAGIGKTRLSLQCGRAAGLSFPDGVWFVDLSAISDPGLVIPAMGHTAPDFEGLAVSSRAQLCSGLRNKTLLFILDNFEQVAEGAALEIVEILKACPRVKFLITSRSPLSVYGEHEYPVPPLSLPDPRGVYSPGELMQFDAVLLFVMRLRQHSPHFELTAAHAPAVVEICRCMDGIPLALELAAVAARRQPLEQLASLLSDPVSPFWLGLLQSPFRDLPQRQRTLYHAIAWSYRLLTAEEQRVLRCLGVFAGDFDTAAAQAVCEGRPVGPLLERLASQYLLARRQVEGQARWFLLEIIREFGREELSPEERRAALERYARYYCRALAGLTEAEPGVIAENARFFRLNVPNLHAALNWAIQTPDTALAYEIASPLTWLWEINGFPREGLAFLPALFQLPGDVSPYLHVHTLHGASNLAWMHQEYDTALTWVRQGIQLASAHGLEEQAIDLLLPLGRIYLEKGAYDLAEEMLQKYLEMSQAYPGNFDLGPAITLLGEVALIQGRVKKARALLDESLGTLKPDQLPWWPMAQTNLAEAALRSGDLVLAWTALRSAFPLARLHVRRLRFFLLALVELLAVGTAWSQIAAAQLLGCNAALRERSDDRLSLAAQLQASELEAQVRRSLPAPDFQSAWDVGRQWSVEEAIIQIAALLRPGALDG